MVLKNVSKKNDKQRDNFLWNSYHSLSVKIAMDMLKEK